MQSDRPLTFDLRFFLASGILLLSLGLVWWLDSNSPEPVSLTPSLTGQPEYCLTCHADLPEISASHSIQTFGCVSCHGGERLALEADLAHSTMRGGANPSDLTVVEQSCGGENCHSDAASEHRDHIQRVQTSIQSTYAGAIANLRFTFGAQPDLTARQGISAVSDTFITTETGLPALAAFDPAQDENPALQQFAANCLTCHLNATPREGKAYARYTGCASCHSFARPGEWSGTETPIHHLSTAIPYTQCNTCHNRGNYDLRTLEFVERSDSPADRLHAYYQPIARFVKCEYTLDCVDCHTRAEAMGDGDLHSHKKEIQYIQCKTCHGTLNELPRTQTITDPNDLALKLAFLNPVIDLKIGDTILITDPSTGSGQRQGEPLWNIRQLPDGNFEMFGKATRQRFIFRPVMGTACEQKPDQQESRYCHECHAVKR